MPHSLRKVKGKEEPILALESMYQGPVFVRCEVYRVCELQKHLKGRQKVWTQLFPLLLRQQGGWDRGAAFFPGVEKRNYCPIVPQLQDVLNSSWETLVQVGPDLC